MKRGSTTWTKSSARYCSTSFHWIVKMSTHIYSYIKVFCRNVSVPELGVLCINPKLLDWVSANICTDPVTHNLLALKTGPCYFPVYTARIHKQQVTCVASSTCQQTYLCWYLCFFQLFWKRSLQWNSFSVCICSCFTNWISIRKEKNVLEHF